MEKYKIRIHKARIEHRFGVDTAQLLDDPKRPKYTSDKAIEILKEMFGYEPNEDSTIENPGVCDGESAYFDYDGYEDVEIPESIVQRIMKG